MGSPRSGGQSFKLSRFNMTLTSLSRKMSDLFSEDTKAVIEKEKFHSLKTVEMKISRKRKSQLVVLRRFKS